MTMTSRNSHIEDGHFEMVPLAHIVSSPTNPRKSFDQTKMDELASTIKATGVHTPILLRYLPSARLQDTFPDRKKGDPLPQYEIVAGERRYRASKIAGVATIPALIRAMSDVQALEVQMLENLQRDDLSELEEAEGYQQLCDLTGIAKDALAEKIGRSRRYIYNRLRLLKLQPLTRDALRDGKIDATAALAIAIVQDGGLQAKALAHALYTDSRKEQPSTRQLQYWMRQNVLLELTDAPFDLKNASLYPGAGACTTCPKRTAANPDLFAETQGPDSCCDAPCYHVKAGIASQLAREKYTAQGIRIIEGDEAREIHKRGPFSGYIRTSQTRMDTPSGQPATLLDLLGKKGAQEVGIVAIECSFNRELLTHVNKAKANAWLLDHKLIVSAERDSSGSPKATHHTNEAAKNLKYLLARKEDRIKQAAYKATSQATQAALLDAPACTFSSGFLTADFFRGFLGITAREYDPDPVALALDCEREVGASFTDHHTKITDAIDAASSSSLLRAFVLSLLKTLKDQADFDESKDILRKLTSDLYTLLAKKDAPSFYTIEAEARQAEQEAINTEAKALQAQLKPAAAKKSPLPKTPLPQSTALPEKNNIPADAARSVLKKNVKAPKLSGEEAQLGIAEAMQGMTEEPGQSAASSDSPQAALPVGFVVGQRIKVLKDVPSRYSKYIGKTGTITGKVNDSSWTVTFKGRIGGVGTFNSAEIEVGS